MTAPTHSQEHPELTLGERFRRAREELNLSLEDVSGKINLRPSILQRLENNEFTHKSIPSTFMKGYVKNYAKFLRVPEAYWLSVVTSLSETTHNDLGKNARATRAVNQYSSHNHWIGYITVIVILILAGMTAMWWWENYQKSNAERDHLVQHYVENTAAAPVGEIADSGSAISLGADKQEAQTVNAPSVAAPVSAEPVAVPATNVADTDANANALSSAVEAPSSNHATSVQTLQSEMNKINGIGTPEGQENAAQSAVQNSDVSAQPAGELQIEVTGPNCWISVKDSNRKVLAQKEYKQGELLSFNQGAPYSLIIGAPGNVKITYKGEVYPLTVDGRVAKFKLQ
ncbi:RodZ domain-containing protein [Necropsobacter massiliensis]|uniref:RodZ domain-containing protein n=1 Tax=Necropsobacter massiliensis TaxID=1400001 RepID=UPI0005962B59|nr:RodZ family helix-turn-helix domain-containing protein [Necropsobacter massiliensis]